LGLPLVVQIAFDIDQNMIAAVLDTVKQKENIHWLAVTSGRYDAMASVWASSTEELTSLLGELARIEGVRNLETFICLQTIKRV
jgi:DNA-binding Lrp family transcriptional regulator